MAPKKLNNTQRPLFAVGSPQDRRGVQIGADRLRVGVGVNALIDDGEKLVGGSIRACFTPKKILAAEKGAAGRIDGKSKTNRARGAVHVVAQHAWFHADAARFDVDRVGANVLIIEHPYQTLPQVRNLLAQFVRMRRELSDDVRRQLQELASCG